MQGLCHMHANVARTGAFFFAVLLRRKGFMKKTKGKTPVFRPMKKEKAGVVTRPFKTKTPGVPDLEGKALAEIDAAGLFAVDDGVRRSRKDDLTLDHQVGAITNRERFPNVMVRYQHADTPVAQRPH